MEEGNFIYKLFKFRQRNNFRLTLRLKIICQFLIRIAWTGGNRIEVLIEIMKNIHKKSFTGEKLHQISTTKPESLKNLEE